MSKRLELSEGVYEALVEISNTTYRSPEMQIAYMLECIYGDQVSVPPYGELIEVTPAAPAKLDDVDSTAGRRLVPPTLVGKAKQGHETTSIGTIKYAILATMKEWAVNNPHNPGLTIPDIYRRLRRNPYSCTRINSLDFDETKLQFNVSYYAQCGLVEAVGKAPVTGGGHSVRKTFALTPLGMKVATASVKEASEVGNAA